MTESKVVNRWIEEALDKDRLESARRFLLRLLRQRFAGEVPPAVVETINTQPSLSMLEDWFDKASRVGSMTDFNDLLRT